jgi:hypothetical protein
VRLEVVLEAEALANVQGTEPRLERREGGPFLEREFG